MTDISLVIPAHNEELSIAETLQAFREELTRQRIPHEILVVNDHSNDRTEEIVQGLSQSFPEIRLIQNRGEKGFGKTVVCGLEAATGKYVAVVMADLSDSPQDLVKFYRKAEEGFDCVFGSRFVKGGSTVGYPRYKYYLNRLTNNIIRALFGIRYNDTTNAFKLYRRDVIENLKPFLSHHFNLTVELPLKSIIRGHSYAIVPNSWINRKQRKSNLYLKEMGSRYFFIILYCLLEKWLSRGDYKKHTERI